MSQLPPELIRTYHPLVEKDLLELGSKNLQLRAVEIIRAISRGEIRGQRLENNDRVGDLSGYFKIYFDESPAFEASMSLSSYSVYSSGCLRKYRTFMRIRKVITNPPTVPYIT